MLKKMNLTGRLGLAFILMALIQGALIAYITWAPFEENMKQQIFAQNQEKASRIANDIERMFAEKFHVISILAKNAEIMSMDEKRQQKVLSTLAESMPEVQLAVISNSKGTQVARWDHKSADHSITYTDRTYFKEVMKTGKIAVSDVLRAKSTGLLGVVVAAPIKDENEGLVGVLIVNIELKDLIEMIKHTWVGNSGYTYVVNNKKQIIIDPENGLMENPIDGKYRPPVEAVDRGKAGFVDYVRNEERILASYHAVPNVQWGVVVEQPYKDAVQGIEKIIDQATIVLALLVILSAGIGTLTSVMIVRPIKNIIFASKRLADGDMKVRIPEETTGELGQLVTSFNKMAEKLESRHEELECMVTERTSELRTLNEELNRIAAIDGLTGLANRRSLDEFLKREWNRAMREKQPISILMIDIDLFKLYNDHFGHMSGDDALRLISTCLKKSLLHSSDLAARYGGEEFTVVLPGTDEKGAVTVAERIQELVEEADISHPISSVSDKITVSIGITTVVPEENSSAEAYISLADKALYEAKLNGRNKIEIMNPKKYEHPVY